MHGGSESSAGTRSRRTPAGVCGTPHENDAMGPATAQHVGHERQPNVLCGRSQPAPSDRAADRAVGGQRSRAVQALRRGARGRRAHLLAPARNHHRVPRPQRRRQDHDAASVARARDPTAGEALIFGRHYRELEHPVRRVGAVLESTDFDPSRSGRNHLRALALATEIPFGRVEELLELVELQRGRRPACPDLLARNAPAARTGGALLGDPELLLLDEPANGLDPAGVHWLRGFLRQFADRGGTVLVSSHVLAEVAQTVDAALIINRRTARRDRRLDELATAPRSLEELYLELTARMPRDAAATLGAAQAAHHPHEPAARAVDGRARRCSSCCCTS